VTGILRRLALGAAAAAILVIPAVSGGVFAASDATASPVAGSRRVSSSTGRTLPVLRQMIYPGAIISREMLTERNFSRAATPKIPVYETIDALTGMVARRTLLPGSPIPLNAVRTHYAVLPGKAVPVTYQSGGLTITGSAVVLQAASAGETVSARNTDSGLVIKATVQSDGTLKVDEP
jgi:flagella basal body P-ring formation protein FlgA